MTLIAGNLILDSTPDPFYDGNQQPSLDLRFAEGKNLNDYVSATPLVDHQRSMSGSNLSAGTFVNSSGLIETAKVNLLPYSKDNLGWSTQDMNNDGAVEGPPGEGQATRFTSVGGTVASRVRYLSAFTTTAGVQYTLSIYVKPLNYNSVSFGLSNIGAGASRSDYNFSTGIVTNAAGTADASMEALGNGWWRLKNTIIAAPSSGSIPTLFLDLGDTAAETHATSEGFDVYGGQIEEGVDLNTYIQTIGVPSAAPRFDHDPTTGESLGLLIEEARTNYITYSEDVGQWAKVVSNGNPLPIVSSGFTSPAGDSTAWRFQGNRSTGSGLVRIVPPVAALPNPHTVFYSIWLKSNTESNQTVNLFLATAGLNATVTPEWQRFYTGPRTATTTSEYIALEIKSNTTQDCDVLVWGAQLEVGSFPTSYIPTSGTALTRSTDVASITGSNFSSWYNQSEGTIFGDYGWTVTTKNLLTTAVGTGTNGNNGLLRDLGTTVTIPRIKQAVGLTNFSVGNVATPDNQISYVNGSVGGLAANIFSPTYPPDLQIGRQQGSSVSYLNGTISRLTYYPYRLADTRLQSLTA
jgi:hypothetical protein